MFIYLFNVICIYIFKKDQIYIECCKKIKFEGITWQRRIKTGSNKLGPFSEKRKLHSEHMKLILNHMVIGKWYILYTTTVKYKIGHAFNVSIDENGCFFWVDDSTGTVTEIIPNYEKKISEIEIPNIFQSWSLIDFHR